MSRPGTDPQPSHRGSSRASSAADSSLAHVLVIEHDAAVAELARRYLERAGMSVRVARTPAEAAAALRGARPSAVVLDLTMPGLSAAAVRRRIAARDSAAMPSLICLEGPGGLRPRHVGVTGAAHCLTRPFSPRALVAQVRSALAAGVARSVTSKVPSPGPAENQVLEDLVLDPAARRVRAAGAPIALTGTEFTLLAHLVANAGRVFTRRQLLATVWGAGAAPSRASTRVVDVYVAQLRAKLGPHSPIRTVRGIGYAADPRETPASGNDAVTAVPADRVVVSLDHPPYPETDQERNADQEE